MRRVVVTGASGFIARRLIQRLVVEGLQGVPVRVVGIARHPPEPDVHRTVEWHVLDLASASTEEVRRACGPEPVVFHLAANASVRSGEAGFINNVASVRSLLEGVQGLAPKRVVYVSSVGAVDRATNDPCLEPLDENSPTHPLTRYGASKLEGERLVAASGVPFAIVRPTWVYGPGMRADSHLRTFLSLVRAGHPLVRGDFPGRVSIIHVDDLCTALVLSSLRDTALSRTFFASDGDPVSLGTIFREMGDIVGRRAGRLTVPGIVVSSARRLRSLLPLGLQLLNSDVLVADNTPLNSLGFTPQVPRRRGLIELARADAPAHGRWIVTGAASGIGRALATQLYASGRNIAAVDRDAYGLASLAMECPGTEEVLCDLSSAGGRARLAQVINEGPLTGLVNCAGIGARGAVSAMPDDAQERLIGVNVTALADATSHALRSMVAQPSGGTLVNIASSAALQPLAGMAAYAASKAFVLSYSEAVAHEVKGTSVKVITACPGGTDTGFQAAAGVKRNASERLMPAADAAGMILGQIDRKSSATRFLGIRVHIMALLARILPRRVVVAFWARLMETMR